MTKLKKCLTILLGAIMLFSITCFFVGCDKTDDGETRYALIAKVVIKKDYQTIKEIVFMPDETLKEVTLSYDKDGYSLPFVISYKYVGHPTLSSENWCITEDRTRYFNKTYLFTDENGQQNAERPILMIERGTHSLTFNPNNAWKDAIQKSFILRVKIT